MSSAPPGLQTSNSGPYLIEMDDLVITKRSSPISNLPIMAKGNQPSDDGNLLLSETEVADILRTAP
jgi:hypothetical protein